MSYRVAVASTDGKVINQHFGHAEQFHIFDVSDENFEFLESRDINACCQGHTHDISNFDRVTELLSDCQAIFVSQIGAGAAAYMIKKGVRVFEAPYVIEDVLFTVIHSQLLNSEDKPS